MFRRLEKVFVLLGVLLLLGSGQALALPFTGSPIPAGSDSYWNFEGLGTATIELENANYRNRNAFGVYSGHQYIQIFSGADSVGGEATLNFTELAETLGTSNFGFYIEGPGGKYFSDSSRNYDKTDHLLAYLGENGELVLGFEDLPGGGDQDYDDLVISVRNSSQGSSTAPVPEPATLLLVGSGLLGLASFRRKHNV